MSVDGVVLTNAMLVYLEACPGRSATLGEMAEHFGTSWQRVLDLLWDASLVELGDVVEAYALNLPSRPGHEEPGEEPATQDSLVSFGGWSAADVPSLALTLDEVIALVGLIDSVSEITPPGQSAAALSTVRAKLVDACEEAGFAGVLWPEPEAVVEGEAMFRIDRAMASGSWIGFSYHRPGPGMKDAASEVRAIPVEVRSAINPVLLAWAEHGARTYRLDRMDGVAVGPKASRRELSAARAAVSGVDSWQPEGETVTLEVAPAGRWIADVLPGARSVRRGDITEVTLRSGSDEFLLVLLLQLGPAVLAIRPREVGERLAGRFAALAEEARE